MSLEGTCSFFSVFLPPQFWYFQFRILAFLNNQMFKNCFRYFLYSFQTDNPKTKIYPSCIPPSMKIKVLLQWIRWNIYCRTRRLRAPIWQLQTWWGTNPCYALWDGRRPFQQWVSLRWLMHSARRQLQIYLHLPPRLCWESPDIGCWVWCPPRITGARITCQHHLSWRRLALPSLPYVATSEPLSSRYLPVLEFVYGVMQHLTHFES